MIRRALLWLGWRVADWLEDHAMPTFAAWVDWLFRMPKC